MAEDDVKKKKYPSLPPNYVSLAQLQERWLQQKQQQQQEEEEERKQKQQEKEAENQQQHQQEQENDRRNRKNRENVKKSGKYQDFDRFGQIQRRPFEKEKGYYKEKWEAKVEKDVGKGVNFSRGLRGKSCEIEGYDGKFKGKCGGGGGSVCMVEEEIPVIESGQEGFRGGLKRNGGGQRSKFGVSENVGEGKEVEGREEGLGRGKKAMGTCLVIGNEEESVKGRVRGGLRRNGSDQRSKFGAFEDVGEGEKLEVRGEGFEQERMVRATGLVIGNEEERGNGRGRRGYKKKWGEKSMLWGKSRRDFEELSLEEGGKGNGKRMAGVNVAKVGILGVESGGNDGKAGYTAVVRRKGDHDGEKEEVLENVGEGEVVDEKGVRLAGEKEVNVGMAMMNQDEGRNGRVRGRYRRNRDKKGMTGTKVRRNFERERARENEAAEETLVVVSGNNGEKDGCEGGLQSNGDDQMMNGEALENVTVGEGLEKSEEKLGGENEAEGEGLMIASQRNGVRVRFRGGYRQNLDKKGVSGEKIGKVFEDLPLNDGRNGKGRRKAVMNGGYQKPAKFGGDRMGKQSDGLMWVKKGEISYPTH